MILRPFRVIKRVGKNAFKMAIPVGFKMHDTINAANLKRAHPRPSHFPTVQTGINVGQHEPEFEILEITGERYTEGIKEYRIVWAGTFPPETTWEPKKNLTNARKALQAYKPQRRGF